MPLFQGQLPASLVGAPLVCAPAMEPGVEPELLLTLPLVDSGESLLLRQIWVLGLLGGLQKVGFFFGGLRGLFRGACFGGFGAICRTFV